MTLTKCIGVCACVSVCLLTFEKFLPDWRKSVFSTIAVLSATVIFSLLTAGSRT
jgi:hypothetical protein